MSPNENQYSRLIGFFIAFLLGVACIVFFHDSHVSGAVALVLVIAAYAAIGAKLYGRTERDAHGDSVYYLGFCLALVGLSVGLLLKDEGQETEQLLNTFGFGLVATVAGLVCRILIQNFATSTDGDVVNAAEELKQSYREFSSSVTTSSRLMNEAMTEFTGKMSEVMGQLSSDMRRTMSDFAQSSVSASEGLSRGLERQGQESIQRVEEVASKSLSAIMVAGHKAVESIHGVAGQITDSVAAAGAVVSDAGSAMKASADAFKRGATQVEKAAGALDNAAVGVEKTTDRVSREIEGLEGAMARLREGMDGAVGPLQEMAELQKAFAQLKNTSTDIHVDLKGILAVIQSVAASAARVQQDAEQAATEVARLARAASEVVGS